MKGILGGLIIVILTGGIALAQSPGLSAGGSSKSGGEAATIPSNATSHGGGFGFHHAHHRTHRSHA